MSHQDHSMRPLIKRALVVDNRLFSQRLTRSMLYMLNCHQVLCATNKPDAQRILSKAPVDIVLLDWHLPRQEASDILAMIRSADVSEVARLPVLIITGRANRDLVNTAAALQADGVLIKPCSVKTLLQGMHSAIQWQRNKWSADGGANTDRELPSASLRNSR